MTVAVEVMINNEGNVKFERNVAGLKGQVALPASVSTTKSRNRWW